MCKKFEVVDRGLFQASIGWIKHLGNDRVIEQVFVFYICDGGNPNLGKTKVDNVYEVQLFSSGEQQSFNWCHVLYSYKEVWDVFMLTKNLGILEF